jgi:trehalose 6-phosphate synthase
MRLLSLRLIVSLILCVTAVSLLSSYFEVRSEKQSLRRDLERRAEVLADSLAGNVSPYMEKRSARELQRIVERFSHRAHLAGVAVFDTHADSMAVSSALPKPSTIIQETVGNAIAAGKEQSRFVHQGDVNLHIYALPLRGGKDEVLGGIAIVHDAHYINAQSVQMWRQSFLRVLVQVFLIASTILLIVRWSVAGPIARAARWVNALRTGGAHVSRTELLNDELLRPLTHEMANFAESLAAARSAAATEAQLRDAADSYWTAGRLAAHVCARLNGSQLFVVSNREPHSHVRQGKTIQAIVPASGLVTALEPVLCAADGKWIAHGDGDADRETVDSQDCLRVPPDEPKYTLRRVWLTKDEEEGYYYGFANEGMWPLCHIAHTRPIFRSSDWEQYKKVNQKFAAAALDEMSDTRQPVILVQDYHFAPLPRLIKKKRPDARIAIFWHIPWPNPEAFAICPWQRELLDGLLGADLIGFHIQAHCTNFMQTVDRTLECRIDWDRGVITREDHQTIVKPFPISVEFNEAQSQLSAQPQLSESISSGNVMELERSALLRDLGLEASLLAVGVDRVDYTKGIPERFLAVERLMERYPAYRGRFTLLQIAAPSRMHIKRYHDLMAEVEAQAEKINWRFRSGNWQPIAFLKRQHSHAEIQRYYRSADLCLVTSLHDGMNLVAKEFVAARHDDDGVLILSRFTGAARELRDAVLVNPYDIERTCESIRLALNMEPAERRSRMRAMRKVVREQNVYRWAANLLADLCEVRTDAPAEEPIEAADVA